MDHEVPVLKVASPDGKLRAVAFGHACHNTTLGFQLWCGDYAGCYEATITSGELAGSQWAPEVEDKILGSVRKLISSAR